MIHKRPHTTTGQALPAQSAMQPGETRVTLSHQLSISLQHLEQRITLLPEPYSCCVLFFTVAARGAEACVFFVRRSTLEAAWREGATRVRQWAWVRQLSAVELRIDWPNEIVVIGSQVPTLRQWRSASAWALADDDLEHAELAPPLKLNKASQSDLETHLKQCIATPSLKLLSDVKLLLRLQGMHIGEDGVHSELPKFQSTQRIPLQPAAPKMPHPWVKAPVCEQHERNNSAGFSCDRLCVTYALLLTQHHIAETELAQGDVIRAIERAFNCVEKNIESLRMRSDADYIEQTMCLLTFTRYISNRNTDGAFSNLISHMERLVRHLNSIKKMPPIDKPS